MEGETFTKINRKRIPENALRYAGKILLVLKSNQNGVTSVIVLNEDGMPHAWPDSMEKTDIDAIVKKYG